jgi:hypothetical protein
MYSAVLLLHSWVRWLVLIAGVLAVARALVGMSGGKPWTNADDRGTMLFSIALDIQMLLGIVLYAGLSPITRLAFADMASAMRNPMLRFWVAEHFAGMLVAVALVHIGRNVITRKAAGSDRHRLAVMFMGVAMVVILLSIPWPWGALARPLFRM